jgi:hypothetical protein
VFTPLNVKAPLPAFTNAPLPDKIPDNVTPLATAKFEPEFKVPAPDSTNAPLFDASPSVALPPKTYAFAIVRAVVLSLDNTPPDSVTNPVPKPALFPTRTAPSKTCNPPLNVLTPLNANAPNPCLINPDNPPTTPLRVTTPAALETFTDRVAPPRFTAPVSVKATLLPYSTSPAKLTAFAMDRVAVANHIEGPVTLTLPRPNAALFPIVNVPPLCVSTPENVFAPLNVNPPEDSVIPPPKFTDPAAENVPPFTKTLPPTEEAALKLSVPPPTLSPPPIVTAPLNVAVFTPDFTKLNAVDPVSVNAPEIVRAPEVFAPPSVNVTGAKVLATSACSVMPTAESLAKV